MKRAVMALTAVLMLAPSARAQGPATMPATLPANAPVDQSTPQGTLILLTRVMQNGDAAAAKNLVHATTPEETTLAGLLVQAVQVNAKFRDAVNKTFGDGVADTYVGSPADVIEAEKAIRASKVEIQNDSATVQSPARPGEDPVKLVRVDGIWKLSMGAIGADEMASTQRDLKMRLEVLSKIADDLTAGFFKNVQHMETEMRTRMAKAILESATPATQPAAPADGR